MTFFVIDWSESNGFLPPIITIGIIALGIALFGAPFFYVSGKRFRQWTSKSKIHDF